MKGFSAHTCLWEVLFWKTHWKCWYDVNMTGNRLFLCLFYQRTACISWKKRKSAHLLSWSVASLPMCAWCACPAYCVAAPMCFSGRQNNKQTCCWLRRGMCVPGVTLKKSTDNGKILIWKIIHQWLCSRSRFLQSEAIREKVPKPSVWKHNAPWQGMMGLSLLAGGSWGRDGRLMLSGWKELLSPAAYSRRCRAVLWDFEGLQREWEQSAFVAKIDRSKTLNRQFVFYIQLQMCSTSHKEDLIPACGSLCFCGWVSMSSMSSSSS